MSIIVFSANIGGYDSIKGIEVYDKNIRYILFSDNKYIKSKVWEVNNINFLPSKLDDRRKARFIKVNSHLVLPKHTISIWIDYCYTPKVGDFNFLLKKMDFYKELIMCYKHNERTCIYEEAKVIKDRDLDYKHLVDNQMNSYISNNFPSNLGLFDSGLTIRKNCNQVNKFNDCWWNEINNGSSRDQLSQVYSAWKNNIIISPIPIGTNIYKNDILHPKVSHSKKIRYK